jgi:cleavage and polyadenylation specificity factor subunit 3
VTQTVSSAQEALKKRVEAVLEIALTAVSSLTESFTTGRPVWGSVDVPASEGGDNVGGPDQYDESSNNMVVMEASGKGAQLDVDEESDEESDFEGVLQVHD